MSDAEDAKKFREMKSIADRIVQDAARYITADASPAPDSLDDRAERFHLYRLCDCTACVGSGKWYDGGGRCPDCRGEGRTRDLIATCATPEAVGVALVTLGREGEWDECPIGILDTMGETGKKWIVRPWLPSARNLSDAGRTLARSKGKT